MYYRFLFPVFVRLKREDNWKWFKRIAYSRDTWIGNYSFVINPWVISLQRVRHLNFDVYRAFFALKSKWIEVLLFLESLKCYCDENLVFSFPVFLTFISHLGPKFLESVNFLQASHAIPRNKHPKTVKSRPPLLEWQTWRAREITTAGFSVTS